MEATAPKPSGLKKFLRFMVFSLAALITLAALLMAEENWRGARAWRDYKSELEAKGDRFDAAHRIPPKVPDNENFAACPYLARNFALTWWSPESPGWTNIDTYMPKSYSLPKRPGWPYGLSADLSYWVAAYLAVAEPEQFDPGNPHRRAGQTRYVAPPPEKMDPAQAAAIILDRLKPCEPVLAELRAASLRRYCRFNVPYENWNDPTQQKAAELTVQHLAVIKSLIRVLDLHAEAELAAGHSELALADINMMLRLEDGLKDEPLYISQLVCYTSMAILLKPIAQGLAEHRWSDAQLRELQDRLGQTDLLASTVQAFYGERDILANPYFDGFPILLHGWDRLEQVNFNRAFQAALLPRINLAGREISPAIGVACDLTMTNYQAGVISSYIHHRIFAGMMLPALFHAPQHAAVAQTDVDLLTVACALERYRLAEGKYPEQLAALAPRFIAKLPHDIINGQPLKYRLAANGKFILYSVGWNEKDDGGVTATNKDGATDRLRGDWVLQYP